MAENKGVSFSEIGRRRWEPSKLAIDRQLPNKSVGDDGIHAEASHAQISESTTRRIIPFPSSATWSAASFRVSFAAGTCLVFRTMLDPWRGAVRGMSASPIESGNGAFVLKSKANG